MGFNPGAVIAVPQGKETSRHRAQLALSDPSAPCRATQARACPALRDRGRPTIAPSHEAARKWTSARFATLQSCHYHTSQAWLSQQTINEPSPQTAFPERINEEPHVSCSPVRDDRSNVPRISGKPGYP